MNLNARNGENNSSAETNYTNLIDIVNEIIVTRNK